MTMQDWRRMLRWVAGLTVFLLLAGQGMPLIVAAAPTVYDFRLVQGIAALPLVKLYADVIGAGDIPAKGLQKEAFQATLGAAETKILRVTPFEDAKEGIGFVLLVDVSKSLSRAQFATMKETLAAFVGSMSDADRVALVTFGRDVKLVQDFTANRARMRDQLAALDLTDDETAFYGGVDKAIAIARAGGADIPQRRVVISLTDGVNEMPGGVTKGNVAERLTADPIPLYLIGFVQGSSSPEQESAIGVMKNFALMSGGRYYDGRGGGWRGIYFAISRAIRSAFVIEIEVANFRSEGAIYPFSVTLAAANKVWTEKLNLTVPAGGTAAQTVEKEQAKPVSATANKPDEAGGDQIWLFAGLGGITLLGLGWLLLRRRMPKNSSALPVQSSSSPMVSGPQNTAKDFVADSHGVLLRLTLSHGNLPPDQIELEIVDRIIVGSDPGESHLVFERDSGIAPAHCELILAAGRLYVQNLASPEGTFLNGVLLAARQRIEAQDILRIGNTEIRIEFLT